MHFKTLSDFLKHILIQFCLFYRYERNIWGPFFSMLNRPDPILMHMVSIDQISLLSFSSKDATVGQLFNGK